MTSRLSKYRAWTAAELEAVEKWAAASLPENAWRALAVVSKHYGLSRRELLGPSRARKITRPRQIAMYLMRMTTNLSSTAIGRAFGGRDHSSVLDAIKQIAHEIDRQSSFGIEAAGFLAEFPGRTEKKDDEKIWTAEMDAELLNEWNRRAPADGRAGYIARKLGRSVSAVQTRISRLKLQNSGLAGGYRAGDGAGRIFEGARTAKIFADLMAGRRYDGLIEVSDALFGG